MYIRQLVPTTVDQPNCACFSPTNTLEFSNAKAFQLYCVQFMSVLGGHGNCLTGAKSTTVLTEGQMQETPVKVPPCR